VDNIAHIDMEFEPEATESEEYVASEFYPVYPLLIVLLGITLLGGVWISRHPMRVPSEILSTEHTGSSVLCHLNKGWEDN
ncbi:MAG: hypothetical protein ACFFCP_06040, partial [Promethearchaeota archaeon]